MSKEASVQSLSSPDRANAAPVAKIFVVCDHKDTAPIGGYIRPQRRLRLILEPLAEKATGFWPIEMSDKVRNRSL